MRQSATYFLLETPSRDIIVHGETGLRVNVISLKDEAYEPTSGELCIYGNDHGEWFVFETEGWSAESMDLITGAVVWYACYLDNPHMEIIQADPCFNFYLKKVLKDINPHN